MTDPAKMKVWRIVTGQTLRLQVDVTALGAAYLAADPDTVRALENAVDPAVLEACAWVTLHGPAEQQGSGYRLR
ncbi:hypothetical protein KNU66_gp82 [Gordonia phage McKinley]|uniref:Uncharacterized protein n=1 Tax=Gordonia phage McKinley TaxID=2588507 RepID=A0A4Y6ELA3_9CAUD|nr:hypothetical protein KNU66_gp82 [Gordonia phage McKinley]QDF19503.1 hypothetical protein SEA_MCKINLEY_82 [Gordonia phage McKinley]